ncbi:MAG: serine hydrolase domain-containing protein, partial [Candidatus Hydrogenedentales bacterium]
VAATTHADLAYLDAARDPEGRGDAKLTLKEMMQRYGVPGVSVAIIRDFEVAEAQGFGVSGADSGEAVTSHTRFQVASISKPIAALAVLRAAQEGKLDLEADINTLLTSWKLPENEFTSKIKVTPAMLLSHTGGTTVHGFPGYTTFETIPTVVQVLNGDGNTIPVVVDQAPGSVWRYSGGGTTIMQLALQDVMGTPFPEIALKTVFEPIGMADSCYCQPPPPEVAALASRGHNRDGESIEGGWHVYPELSAAGLWTTPTDLCKAAIDVQCALRGDVGRVLKPETARQMLADREVGEYGLGFGLSRHGADKTIYFQHGGSNEGFRCELIAHMSGGYGAAIMTNGDVGTRIVNELISRIAAHDNWEGRW